MLIYVLRWWPSWISDRHKKQKLGKGHSNDHSFSQSKHIIGPGSHVEHPTGTKNRNFVEDHPRNIPAKLGSQWFRKRRLKCEKFRRRTPSDGNSSPGPFVQVNLIKQVQILSKMK
jgi:hypothetical protein